MHLFNWHFISLYSKSVKPKQSCGYSALLIFPVFCHYISVLLHFKVLLTYVICHKAFTCRWQSSSASGQFPFSQVSLWLSLCCSHCHLFISTFCPMQLRRHGTFILNHFMYLCAFLCPLTYSLNLNLTGFFCLFFFCSQGFIDWNRACQRGKQEKWPNPMTLLLQLLRRLVRRRVFYASMSFR